MHAREYSVAWILDDSSWSRDSNCPWKKSSMTFFHVVDRWKRRGFPGSTIAASCGGRLVPQPATVAPPGVQSAERVRRFGEQRRVAEIPLGHFAAAPGKERRVDMQLEVQSQALFGRGVAYRPEDAHQRLGRGEMARLGLVAEPVAARRRCRVGQPHAAAECLTPKHFPSLAPCAIEQEHVQARDCIGWACGRQCLAARMKNQELAAGSDRVGWKASGRVEAVFR